MQFGISFSAPVSLDKRKKMGAKLHKSWTTLLENEMQKPYFNDLMSFVRQEYEAQTVYPAKENIFAAFNHTPFDKVKVVIIGQDPYHGAGQAHGLSFSVNDGVPHPPSLRNIFSEIQKDIGKPIPQSGNLTRWAAQGVLMLNAVLTVREATPASHQKKGWEQFTDAVIREISEKGKHVVFMLWGTYAKQKGLNIDPTKHLILRAAHPSPMSANQGGWFGNRHFSQANVYLQSKGEKAIEW